MKIRLTKPLLDNLEFDRYPVGLKPDGSLKFGKRPPKVNNDWILRDTETKGLAVRVSRGLNRSS